MQTLGIFAGRGDVILGMTFAMLFGMWLGWHLHKFKSWMKTRKDRV